MMNRRDLMEYSPSRLPPVNKERSQFNLSKRHVTTFDAGYLIPIYNKMVYPGDTFTWSANGSIRLLSPLKSAPMDNIRLDLHCFWVPFQLLYENFVHLIGEKVSPLSTTEYLLPQIAVGVNENVPTHSIYDYMGIPTRTFDTAGIAIQVAPFRAYNQIVNAYYFDQDIDEPLIERVDEAVGGTIEEMADYFLVRRRKPKDYFTAARPYPQKGATTVGLPLGSIAPVRGNGQSLGLSDGHSYGGLTMDNTHVVRFVTDAYNVPNGTTIDSETPNYPLDDWHAIGASDNLGNTAGLIADLSTIVRPTVNDIRYGIMMQSILELDSRYGSRYPEHLYAHWGVTSSDGRMFRPEYLGGGSTYINFVPVAQTSSTTGTEYQGQIKGFGVANGDFGSFQKTFEEHGWIVCLVSAVADITYHQGVDQDFWLKDRWDLYDPMLAGIGEQPILSRELYCDGTADDVDVHGYSEAYARLRFDFGQLSGLMRYNVSSGNTSLSQWNLAENFESRPLLNSAFLEANPPIDRVVAVPSQPHFIGDFLFNVKGARVLPTFGTPASLVRV